MRVLIACEYSGIVREAFKAKRCDAWSCDLIETEIPGQHYKCDVRKVLNKQWDLMIAHPPCTYLSVSGNRHFPKNPERWIKRYEAMMFVWELMNADINKIAIENPISVITSWIRKPDQIIKPYYFGENVPKSICLWLKNLPLLKYELKDNLFGDKTSVEPEYIEYNSKKTKSGKSKYSILGKLGKGKGKERSKFF